ncbi:MAG: CopD family protein, partial [Tomitella sp.]|nr:CopD family protein [Tomitella sp.]
MATSDLVSSAGSPSEQPGPAGGTATTVGSETAVDSVTAGEPASTGSVSGRDGSGRKSPSGGGGSRTTSIRDSGIGGLFVVCAGIAGLVAAMLSGLSLTTKLSALGIDSAGAVTDYGIPILRAAGEIASVIMIGSLLLAAFLVPPQRNGILDVDGYRAVRTASIAAMFWAAVGLLMVPLQLSQASGRPLSEAMVPSNALQGIDQVEASRAWLAVAIFAIVLAVGCRLILRWGWTPFLFALSVISLLPLAIIGHSSSGGAHDIGVNSLIYHLVGASVWAGGLFAILAHARRKGAHTDVAIRRYSKIAMWCLIVVGISGVVNALIRIRLSDIFTTTYGAMIIGKVV